MGIVRLADEKHLAVDLDGDADRRVLETALRATVGCDSFATLDEESRFPLENVANIVALWATGFQWRQPALEAVLREVMPLLQRRAAMRTLTQRRDGENPTLTA